MARELQYMTDEWGTRLQSEDGGRNWEPAPAEEFRPRVQGRCLADVEPEDLRWLWPGKIPFGKLTLLSGDPGLGKSFASMDVAARLSTGCAWPDDRENSLKPANTVILSAEDDPGDTIRPRLDAADADPSRIFVIESVKLTLDDDGSYFSLERDMRALEDCIVEHGAKLVIIDPISAYITKKDSHNNSEIRSILAPLAALAAKHDAAVVAITHLNKGGSSKALYRSMGSIAFAAAARVALLVAQDKDDPDRRLVLPVKCNISETPTAIAFRIVDGQVVWDLDPISDDADSVLEYDPDDRTAKQDAKDWLERRIDAGGGQVPVKELEREAKAECHSWRTVQRAKKDLKLKAVKSGAGNAPWVWYSPDRLPKAATPDPVEDVGGLGGLRVNDTENAGSSDSDIRRPPDRQAAGDGGLYGDDGHSTDWATSR